MFIVKVTHFAERFLTDRSFDLIVAPALADFEYDTRTAVRPVHYVAVVRAVAGAVYEDAMNSSAVATFAVLAIIPAVYYAFFFLLCAPEGLHTIANNRTVAITLVTLTALASMVPVVVCFWPERRGPSRSPEL
jgi:hypothetical protein